MIKDIYSIQRALDVDQSSVRMGSVITIAEQMEELLCLGGEHCRTARPMRGQWHRQQD
jgi:hypothetical protein